MNQRLKNLLFISALVLLAGFVRAVAVYSFIVPNAFAPGGITGIGSIVEFMTATDGHAGFSAGYTMLILNVPLLALAFFFLGKKFALTSGVATVLSSMLMVVFQKIDFYVYTDERILAAAAGGILTGVSLALMLKTGGTMGGTDIIATFIQRKHSATNVAWFIFALDSTVVVASLFFFKNGLTPAILSFIEMFASSKMCDVITSGHKSAIKFEIVTTKPQELSDAILKRLHRGVTKLDAVGMYTDEPRAVLVCLIRRRQVSEFRKLIKAIDPDAFAYMSQASEVLGLGFPHS